ncbi:MAG: CPBP family intramembrane metalloprotease [Tissierellia bacterium]|nr:CPBP family intramembrane metalloprotease [Tissierellia bacterium]
MRYKQLKYEGKSMNLTLLLCYILLSVAAVGATAIMDELGIDNPSENFAGTISIFMVAIQFIPIYIYFNKRGGLGSLLNGVGLSGKEFIAAIIITLAINSISGPLMEGLESRLSELGLSMFTNYPDEGPGIGDYYVLTFYTVIVAPFVEEIIYRGVIVGTLKRYSKTLAIVVSGIIFGMMHGNLFQAVYATILGMWLAYLMIETGSIWAPILLHIINNLYATIVNDIMFPVMEDMGDVLSIYLLLEVLIFAILGVALFIYFIFSIKRKREWKELGNRNHEANYWNIQNYGNQLQYQGNVQYFQGERPIINAEINNRVTIADHVPGDIGTYFSLISTWVIILLFLWEILADLLGDILLNLITI